MAQWEYVQVLRSTEFENWLMNESPKIQALVEARIFRMQHHNHFGDAKHLGERLSELRWKNGLRVYFSRVGNRVIILLYGGGKNEQKNDIKKERVLLERYTNP